MVDWNAIARANTERTLAQARYYDAQANALGMPKTTPAPTPAPAQTETPKDAPPQTPEERMKSFGVVNMNSQSSQVAPAWISGDVDFTKAASSFGRKNFPVSAGRGMLSPTEDLTEDSTDKIGMPLKKGIARVPGKGDGTKDTVPSMLAPGEAVLNKAAADKMGRGLIAALNKMGAQKMGLV